MPIIYMHGVNTKPDHFAPIEAYLRRIVAPAISSKPNEVPIQAADWFGLPLPPKWGGISRPRTILLSAGAKDPEAAILDSITATLPREASRAVFTRGEIRLPPSRCRSTTCRTDSSPT